MYLMILFVAAIIPIIALCSFVYIKDKNKEPKGLLALIFFLGLLTVIPILFCELFFSALFPSPTSGFIPIFLNVLFGVALYEESFKWLVVHFFGYNNKAFDEVYDIIIYSVFASLGFACFENILYVFQYGLGNAVVRALLAIPGHTCFAISMGYFFSRAKVGQINNNRKLYHRSMVLSIVVPILLHTCYDAFLFYSDTTTTFLGFILSILPFYIFFLAMVIICFITVDKTAKVQQNLKQNLDNGTIAQDKEGYIYYTSTNPPTVPNQQSVPSAEYIYCPLCGKPTKYLNFCLHCGFRLK